MITFNVVEKFKHVFNKLFKKVHTTYQKEQKNIDKPTYTNVYHAVFYTNDLNDFIKSFSNMLVQPSEKINDIETTILIYLYNQLKEYSKEAKTVNNEIKYMFPQISEELAVYVSLSGNSNAFQWDNYRLFQIDFTTYKKEILLDIIEKLTEKHKNKPIYVTCESIIIEKGIAYD